MARVTGIGGVFLKSPDPKRLTAWYTEHLGIVASEYGITFHWSDEQPAGTGSTSWAAFPEASKYFGPTQQSAMINYRVDDLDHLLLKLQQAGVWIDPKREEASYGKFAWVKDCDGNRLELWQPLTS